MEDLSLLVERARTRLAGGTWDALSDRDRILITVWELEADVNNGGFDQYFFNSAGDLGLVRAQSPSKNRGELRG
jgi:hypothetical protein